MLVAVGLMIATFVGARVLARRRELALLKAAGFTPRQLMLLALIENLAIALVGAVVGVVAGAAAAPRIVKDTAALTGRVPVTVDVVTVAGVIAVVLAAVALATVLPARRTVRAATVDALARSAVRSRLSAFRASATASRSGSVSGRRWRGPAGRWRSLVALALGVGALTAALAMEATLTREDAVENAARATFPPPVDASGLGPSHADPVVVPDLGREQVRPIVWGLNVLLLLVIVANVLATTLLGVRERARENGVLRAVGVTPRELSGSIVGSQVVLATIAAAVGIPFGIGLFVGVYRLASGAVDPALAPAWQLAAVAVATVAAVALVSLLPARSAGRLAVVDALRRE